MAKEKDQEVVETVIAEISKNDDSYNLKTEDEYNEGSERTTDIEDEEYAPADPELLEAEPPVLDLDFIEPSEEDLKLEEFEVEKMEELGKNPLDIKYGNPKSFILKEETKA